MHDWLVVALPFAALVVALLAWLLPKSRRGEEEEELPNVKVYDGLTSTPIHATNGVPTLEQLTIGIELDAKRMDFAEKLYEIGLAQFNRYINNRDGVICNAKSQMDGLVKHFGAEEMIPAKRIGFSLAKSSNDVEESDFREEYEELSPYAQVYTQHKRIDSEALKQIARDLEMNVPRTDYTAVKAQIASGVSDIDTILSDLPVPWQEIRSLSKKVERPKATGKPPKREFLHVMFNTRDHGLLEDKRAEKDDDWIISDKHNYMVPYQPPADLWEVNEFGKPHIWKGKAVIITHDATSEWETEFWRQGGRMDQVYFRARNGMSPEQLWRAYRKRQFNLARWSLVGSLLLVDIALVMSKYL